MRKLLLGLGLLVSLVSCNIGDDIPMDLTHLPSEYYVYEDIPEEIMSQYVELEHYFDEHGNPLPQKELHEKLVKKYNKGQIYTYREARKEAIELIKYYESFEANLYRCPSGKLTLGYGLTGKYLKGRKTISKKEAEQELKYIYDDIYDRIEKNLGRRLEEHKMASLVSFAFNVGEQGLYSSTLFKKIKNGNANIGKEFDKYIYYRCPKTNKMKVANGLVSRRKAEFNLFNV